MPKDDNVILIEEEMEAKNIYPKGDNKQKKADDATTTAADGNCEPPDNHNGDDNQGGNNNDDSSSDKSLVNSDDDKRRSKGTRFSLKDPLSDHDYYDSKDDKSKYASSKTQRNTKIAKKKQVYKNHWPGHDGKIITRRACMLRTHMSLVLTKLL